MTGRKKSGRRLVVLWAAFLRVASGGAATPPGPEPQHRLGSETGGERDDEQGDDVLPVGARKRWWIRFARHRSNIPSQPLKRPRAAAPVNLR